jgi:hypothetical protein
MPTREELDQLLVEVDTDPELSAEEKEILFSDIEAELDKLEQAEVPTGPQPPGFLRRAFETVTPLGLAQRGVEAARKPIRQAVAKAIPPEVAETFRETSQAAVVPGTGPVQTLGELGEELRAGIQRRLTPEELQQPELLTPEARQRLEARGGEAAVSRAELAATVGGVLPEVLLVPSLAGAKALRGLPSVVRLGLAAGAEEAGIEGARQVAGAQIDPEKSFVERGVKVGKAGGIGFAAGLGIGTTGKALGAVGGKVLDEVTKVYQSLSGQVFQGLRNATEVAASDFATRVEAFARIMPDEQARDAARLSLLSDDYLNIVNNTDSWMDDLAQGKVVRVGDETFTATADNAEAVVKAIQDETTELLGGLPSTRLDVATETGERVEIPWDTAEASGLELRTIDLVKRIDEALKEANVNPFQRSTARRELFSKYKAMEEFHNIKASEAFMTDSKLETFMNRPVAQGLSEWVNKSINSRYLANLTPSAATKIDSADRAFRQRLGDHLHRLEEDFMGLTEKELVNLPRMLDGKLELSPKAAKVRQVLDEVAELAENAGLTIKKPDGTSIPWQAREDFFPQWLKQDVIDDLGRSGPRRNKIVRAIARRNNLTPQQAEQMAKALREHRTLRGQQQARSLEFARTMEIPEEFLERDVRKVIPEYLRLAHKRLADAEFLGADTDVFLGTIIPKGLIPDLAESSNPQLAAQLTQRALRLEAISEGTQAASEFFSGLQIITKMHSSAITNLGDISKTVADTGFVPTIKAAFSILDPASKKAFREAGGLPANVMNLGLEFGTADTTRKFLRLVGFEATEAGLRQIQVTAAQRHAQTLVEGLARQVRKHGADAVFNSKRGARNVFGRNFAFDRLVRYFDNDFAKAQRAATTGKIEPQDLKDIGSRALEETQPINRLDAPFHAQSPGGRLVFQFKTWALKHSRWLWDNVAGQAKTFIATGGRQGSFGPLMRFLATASMFGEFTQDAKSFLRTGNIDEIISRDGGLNLKRMVNNIARTGQLGLYADSANAILGRQWAGQLSNFLLGPTFSDFTGLLVDGGQAVTGNAKPLAKRITAPVRNAPLVGPVARKTLDELGIVEEK